MIFLTAEFILAGVARTFWQYLKVRRRYLNRGEYSPRHQG